MVSLAPRGWAESFPDPRQEAQTGMEVLVASHLAARFAGFYSMRKNGYVACGLGVGSFGLEC